MNNFILENIQYLETDQIKYICTKLNLNTKILTIKNNKIIKSNVNYFRLNMIELLYLFVKTGKQPKIVYYLNENIKNNEIDENTIINFKNYKKIQKILKIPNSLFNFIDMSWRNNQFITIKELLRLYISNIELNGDNMPTIIKKTNKEKLTIMNNILNLIQEHIQLITE